MAQDWKPASFTPEWKPKSFSADAPVDDEEKGIGSKVWDYIQSTRPVQGINKFITSHADELTGQKPGVLNPNPDDNPFINKPLLPETTATPGMVGTARHAVYDKLIRPMTSPLGILGTALDASPPTEPIGLPKAAAEIGPIKKAPLALPPAPREIEQNIRTFYNGPAGTTQAGKTYPMDIAPQTPRLGQTDAGTILPKETEGLTNLDPITAANRGTRLGDIQSVDTSSIGGNLRSLGKSTSEPFQMPKGQAKTKPVTIDPYIEPYMKEPQYPAADLAESGKNLKPINIESPQDRYDARKWIKDDASEALQEELESKTPDLNMVRDLKKDANAPIGDLSSEGPLRVRLQDHHLSDPEDNMYAHPDSPNANPLVIRDKKLAALNTPKQDIGNIGKPELPYQLETASKESKYEPHTFVPDTPKTPVAKGSSEGVRIGESKVYSNGVPSAGQAVSEPPNAPPVLKTNNTKPSRDVNAFRAELGSVDKTLSSRPETAPIAQHIIGAADQKAKWIATTERALADHTKGLSNGELIDLGNIVDQGVKPGDNPVLAQKALAIKDILDQVHADLKIPTSITGGKIGYIENYLSHISKLPEDDLKSGMKQIWEYHVGKPFKDLFGSAELDSKSKPMTRDFYERGLGNPDSPFRKTRADGMPEIELNVNKVLPAYIESIARLKFDREAVDQAKSVLAGLPDKDIYGEPSKLKELAGWYIKNYTRYDAMPGLTQGWNDWSQKVMRTTARSMLGFSTGLQTLHLARIPANLWPELGTKYLAKGAAQVAKNPKAAYAEAASLGLLQNEVRPWAFKTPMQRVDSLQAFMSAADFLDRSIGYHGFKMKFLDEGMDEATASSSALAKSKDASLLIDSARPTKIFNPEGSPGGAAWRLMTQFKQVPVRIIEQYIGIASKMKEDPKTAARMVAGIGLAVAAQEAGMHTFHISPGQAALQFGGAVGTVVSSVYRDLSKGDIVSALKKTALWITPGGMSIERQMRRGPSAFESDNQPARLRP